MPAQSYQADNPLCCPQRTSRPAHTRHRGSTPILLTEHPPQTTFPHPTHRDAPAAAPLYPSISISAPSSPLHGILVPQSSQLVWSSASASAAFSIGDGSMSGRAAGEGMFQNAWRDLWPADREGGPAEGGVWCDGCAGGWGRSWLWWCCWCCAEYSIFNVFSIGRYW